MAKMKSFAVWLAKNVLILKLPESEIIEQARKTWNIGHTEEDRIWLTEQIDTVKDDPYYRTLANRDNG